MSEDWAKVCTLFQMIETDPKGSKSVIRGVPKRVERLCDRVQGTYSRLVNSLRQHVSEFEVPAERAETPAEIERLAAGGKSKRLQ